MLFVYISHCVACSCEGPETAANIQLLILLKVMVCCAAEGAGIRCELAGVRYEYNVLGTRGPRKMTALIPGTDAHGQNYIFRPEAGNDSILDR